MTRPRPVHRLAVMSGALLLAMTGCAHQGSDDAVRPSTASGANEDVRADTDPMLARYYQQNVSWGECDYPSQDPAAVRDLDCARVTVPVDYGHPKAGDTYVVMSRLKSTDSAPQGTLFLNPGGPGASGVDLMPSATFFASATLRENYDIVGFDPRGVGRSDGITCLDDREMDAWRAEPAFDPATQSLGELRASYRDIGEQCHQHSSAVVSHMDTQSVAKDLDVMRAVLGQSATHYLGFSYGTEIGAAYASLFPKRAGRMVLDGAVDPTLDERAVTLAQAKGFEDNLRHWVQDCQRTNNRCAVGEDGVEQGMQRIRDLLKKVSDERITVSDGRRLTATNALEGILVPLYSTASYSQLNSALADAFDNNFDALMSNSDSNHGRDSSGKYTSNVSSAFAAVNCLDTRSRDVSDREMAQAARTMAKEAPTFGPYLGYGDAACQAWPDRPVQPLKTYQAATDQPLLVIGTTHDPATPYPWAESLTSKLGNARLLTNRAWGHTAYTSGDECVTKTVDNYLISGALPEDGASCGDA